MLAGSEVGLAVPVDEHHRDGTRRERVAGAGNERFAQFGLGHGHGEGARRLLEHTYPRLRRFREPPGCQKVPLVVLTLGRVEHREPHHPGFTVHALDHDRVHQHREIRPVGLHQGHRDLAQFPPEPQRRQEAGLVEDAPTGRQQVSDRRPDDSAIATGPVEKGVVRLHDRAIGCEGQQPGGRTLVELLERAFGLGRDRRHPKQVLISALRATACSVPEAAGGMGFSRSRRWSAMAMAASPSRLSDRRPAGQSGIRGLPCGGPLRIYVPTHPQYPLTIAGGTTNLSEALSWNTERQAGMTL